MEDKNHSDKAPQFFHQIVQSWPVTNPTGSREETIVYHQITDSIDISYSFPPMLLYHFSSIIFRLSRPNRLVPDDKCLVFSSPAFSRSQTQKENNFWHIRIFYSRLSFWLLGICLFLSVLLRDVYLLTNKTKETPQKKMKWNEIENKDCKRKIHFLWPRRVRHSTSYSIIKSTAVSWSAWMPARTVGSKGPS